MTDLDPDPGLHRVVVVGDLLADVVVAPHGPLRRGTDTPASITSAGGGSAGNTATWLAWSGRSVSLLAAVGDDPLGRSVLADLAAHGVEHLGPLVPGGRTGCCVVLVDAEGERTLLPDRAVNDDLRAEQVGMALDDADLSLGAVGWVHLSGYTLLHAGSRAAGQEVVRRTRAAGVGLSIDAASAGPLADMGADAFLALVDGADLLLANEDELDALGGETKVLEAVRALVTKRGAAGARWSDGHERTDVLAHPADVVDTTGAGDAFAGGFLASWVGGARIADALAAGAARAAEAVARPGGRPHLDPAA